MSTNSVIEWTDCTWNPVVGCTRVSAGCDHCYAVRQSFRLEQFRKVSYTGLTVVNPRGERHFNGTVRTVHEALEIPLHWKKPRRVFVNSMSDVFHPAVPFEFIDRVFAVMALCPQHSFQVLTKRPERMAEYLGGNRADDVLAAMQHRTGRADHRGTGWPLPGVWLGTSCEDQPTAEERIPHLLRCPAAVRFLSLEPLLGPINLLSVKNTSPPMPGCPNGAPSRRIDWVIVGGESGPRARPCSVAWIRSIVAQCKAAGVPCFVKQLGAHVMIDDAPPWHGDFPTGTEFTGTRVIIDDPKGGDMNEWPEDLRVREFPR